jgi:hypothetical protein
MSQSNGRVPRTTGPSHKGHLADFVIFRVGGFLIIYNEVKLEPVADWHVLAAGFAMVFMPDALRGKDGLAFRLLTRFTNGNSHG